jgi:23S rRNA pseudouridine1911/1915/1917 synthase
VTRTVVFTVAPEQAGQRLDKVLTARVPGVGRRQARRLFEAGAVRVAGRRAVKATPARAGEQVSVKLGEPERAIPEPEAPLRVCLETPDLVVVDKPAGQPTAALSATNRGSLACALVGHYPEMATVGYDPREPGLLHRLDTLTSGLLLAARSQPVFEQLRRGQATKRLLKRYLAVVAAGPLDARGVIGLPLAHHPTDPRRVIACDARSAAPSAHHAATRFQVLRRSSNRALLELQVYRAFRHQIRVHLAALGCPIIGDQVYGGAPCRALGSRHALHANRLQWSGDGELAAFVVESPLPAELASLLSE